MNLSDGITIFIVCLFLLALLLILLCSKCFTKCCDGEETDHRHQSRSTPPGLVTIYDYRPDPTIIRNNSERFSWNHTRIQIEPPSFITQQLRDHENEFIDRLIRDHSQDETQVHKVQSTNYREEASNCAGKRKEFVQLAKQARRLKNFRMATKYSNQANVWKVKMESANRKAADEIFKQNNAPGRTDIDLHNLYVNEALDKLKQRIAEIEQRGWINYKLTVIVGRGLHSAKGPKIKPAVEKYAIKQGITYEVDSPRVGCITFTLP